MPSPRHSDQSERRAATSKRRGAKEFSCESCGKVYRHPNCLIKHRWEHNPYWREAAQFLLSKHQQVQLMEAAAILTGGDALPSDRALWPAYMSDGTLPEPKISADGTIRETSVISSPTPSGAYSTRTRSAAVHAQQNALSTSPSPFEHDQSDMEDETNQSDNDERDQEEDDEDDDKTDESEVYSAQPYHYQYNGSVAAQDIRPRARRSPAPGHHYHPYAVSPRVASHNSPVMRAGWGVISDAHSHYQSQSPPAKTKTAMPISYNSHSRSYSAGQHSLSSFSPIPQSFSSASTSSYIPHSSVRDVEEGQERHGDTLKSRRVHHWSPPVVHQVVGDYHDGAFEMDMD